MRAFRAFFFAALLLALWLIIAGGMILAKFYEHQNEIPLWKLGQFALFVGTIQLVLLILLWWASARQWKLN